MKVELDAAGLTNMFDGEADEAVLRHNLDEYERLSVQVQQEAVARFASELATVEQKLNAF